MYKCGFSQYCLNYNHNILDGFKIMLHVRNKRKGKLRLENLDNKKHKFVTKIL